MLHFIQDVRRGGIRWVCVATWCQYLYPTEVDIVTSTDLPWDRNSRKIQRALNFSSKLAEASRIALERYLLFWSISIIWFWIQSDWWRIKPMFTVTLRDCCNSTHYSKAYTKDRFCPFRHRCILSKRSSLVWLRNSTRFPCKINRVILFFPGGSVSLNFTQARYVRIGWLFILRYADRLFQFLATSCFGEFLREKDTLSMKENRKSVTIASI